MNVAWKLVTRLSALIEALFLNKADVDSLREQLASAYALNQELRSKIGAMEGAYDALAYRWNAIVRKVNARGGERFLRSEQQESPGLSHDDISRLLMLCHPDRHGGSRTATEMTVKLLTLREQQRQDGR